MIVFTDDMPGWAVAVLVALGVAVNAVAAWSTWAWYRSRRDDP
jgi:hypothetical protein